MFINTQKFIIILYFKVLNISNLLFLWMNGNFVVLSQTEKIPKHQNTTQTSLFLGNKISKYEKRVEVWSFSLYILQQFKTKLLLLYKVATTGSMFGFVLLNCTLYFI